MKYERGLFHCHIHHNLKVSVCSIWLTCKVKLVIHVLIVGFSQINWDNVFRKENSHPGTATPLTPPPPVRGRGRGRSPSLPRRVRQCPGSLPPLRKVSARNQPPCWRSSETTPCSSSFKASSGVHCTLNALVGPTSDPKVNAFYKFH